MNKIQKLLSSWWKKVIFFSILVITIHLAIDFTIRHYFYSIEFIFTYYNYNYSIFLSLIISSVMTEGLTTKSDFFTFGLSMTKRTFVDIFCGFLLVIIPFCLLTILVNYANLNLLNNIYFNPALSYMTIFILIAAINEELIFRGIIFQALLDRFGIGITLFLSGLLFASMHLFNYNIDAIGLINTFIAGLVFGVMYLQTKSLYLSISYHFFWNYLQELLMNSNISGYEFDFSFYSNDLTSLPKILFGGLYGIEGGIIATILLIITGLLVTKLIQSSPFLTSKLLRRKIY